MKSHLPSSELNDNQRAASSSSLSALVPAGTMLIIAVLARGNFLPQRITLKPQYIQTVDNRGKAELVLPASSVFIVGNEPNAETINLQGRLENLKSVPVVSPASGMIARVLVEDGQSVKSGDVVAMISNQATATQDDGKVTNQKNAEKAQESVAQQQSELQRKLDSEQKLLHEANERVDRASKRLNNARILVQRLRNGEQIKRSEASKIDLGKAAERIAPKTTTHSPEKEKTQPAPNTKAQGTAAHPVSKEPELQEDTQQDETAEISPTPSSEKPVIPRPTAPGMGLRIGGIPAASNEDYITAEEAMRIARSALQESNEALERVDKIQAQIKRYQSSVKKNTDDLHAAASRLEATQRALFDNPPQVKMTPITAPTDGAIHTSVALTNNVSEGDKIASIVPPQLLLLELRDTTGLWKKLQEDDTFEVEVATEDNEKVLSDARLISITPSDAEDSAILRLQVFNPPQKKTATNQADNDNSDTSAERQFEAGMETMCRFPVDGSTVTIPHAAILQENEIFSVVVLQPLSENGMQYRAEERRITVKEKHESGASVSGLKRGERIAILTPDDVSQLQTHNDIKIRIVG